jgi:hypothetical protein
LKIYARQPACGVGDAQEQTHSLPRGKQGQYQGSFFCLLFLRPLDEVIRREILPLCATSDFCD